MIKLIDSCLTLDILKQDSGLLPKPKENWNTFEPQVGMIAYVDKDEAFYQFDGTDWVQVDIELTDKLEEIGEYIYEELYYRDN